MTDVYTEATSPSGTRYWYKNGQYHRDGGQPAVIYADGARYWYKNGQFHRDGDEPAVIQADGTRYWYKNGRFHHDGGEPAAILADGTRYWYKNGQPHRDGDQPAVIYADGTRYWYKNGQPHQNGDTEFTALAADGGYTLYRIKDKTAAVLYISGCRRFTLAQAREHWCTKNPTRPDFAEAILKESEK
jgi:hypothetical protein